MQYKEKKFMIKVSTHIFIIIYYLLIKFSVEYTPSNFENVRHRKLKSACG